MAIDATDTGDDEELELKMTSMIDVVFLLLIFFIVTLKIPKKEAFIETRLPEAKGVGEVEAPEEETDKQEFQDIKLMIRDDPNDEWAKVYVGGQRMRSPGELATRLKMFRKIKEDGRVVVQCGDAVPYQDLVKAISVVQAIQLPMAFGGLR